MAAQMDQPLGESDLLLLYLSGELPGSERRGIEERLAVDDEFRQRLISLQETYDFCAKAFEKSELGVSPRAKDAALRRTSRLFSEWAEKRRDTIAVPAPARRRFIPWTRYGLAIAAAILMAVLGRWAIDPISPTHAPRERLAAAPVSKEDEIVLLKTVWSSLDASPTREVEFDVLPSSLVTTDKTNIFFLPTSGAGQP